MSKVVFIILSFVNAICIINANNYSFNCLNPSQYAGDSTSVNPSEFGGSVSKILFS